MEAMREMLAEGRFHEATVAEVAERAGVSRATLYQHFGTRVGLVDAICETLAENPALLALRQAPEQRTATEVLEFFLRETVRFWASEEAVHRHLYGLAVIDPAAADFVARQRRDRGGEVARVIAALAEHRALSPALDAKAATRLLMVLSSFAVYDELRRGERCGEREIVETLLGVARSQLLAPAERATEAAPAG